jgi:four helix bundle protein
VPVRSYEDLRVWQASMDLVVRVYRLGRTLPDSEKYGLRAQMQRAAVSIPANIAEGHGRSHLGDKLRFFSVANGSLKEVETEIKVAARLGLVSSEEAQVFAAGAERCGRMLSCLMRGLRRRAASTTTHQPPTAN